MAIAGNVYNASNFTKHPGGKAYVPYCGRDASEGFNTKGEVGRPHSDKAVAGLKYFLIGTLASQTAK